ncbi:MAG: Ig-like domain-containing protein [Planctomycetota bacterium]
MLRHWVRMMPIVAIGWLAGCNHGGGGGGSPTGATPQPQADLPGEGGGIFIADVFEGAWIRRTPPQVLDCEPSADATGVPSTTPVVITFSESIDTSTVTNATLQLRARGGKAVEREIRWYLGNTVAILLPLVPLRPAAEYEVVLKNTITDLTGHHLFSPTGDTRLYRRFRTSATDEGARILQILPRDGTEHVYRRTETLAVFDAPVRTGGQSGSIEDTGNYRVIADGRVVKGTLRIEGNDRIAVCTPAEEFEFNAQVEVDISHAVRDESGLELRDGGRVASFRAIEFASPRTLSFPGNRPVSRPIEADGFIAERLDRPSLHAFDVQSRTWPSSVTQIGLLFVDKRLKNGLRFEDGPTEKQIDLTVDLEPDASREALSDGLILVGGYAALGDIEGPIDIVRTLLKDTDTFTITELGPPNGGTQDPLTLISTLRNPAVYGRADQPAAAFSIELGDGGGIVAAILHLAPERWTQGQATFDDGDSGLTDAFLTATWPEPIPLALEPVPIRPAEGSDVLGNEGAVRFASESGEGAILQVGVVGASTTSTDGLKVLASDLETFQALDGTDVIVQPYPPSADDLLVVRSTPATFTRSELSSLVPSERLMATLLHDGYHVVSYAGLKNPATSGHALGIHAALEPAHPGYEISTTVTSPGEDYKVSVGGNSLLGRIPDQRWFIDVAPAQTVSLPVLGGRLKAFCAVAERDLPGGERQFRTAFELPRLADAGSVVLDLAKAPELLLEDALEVIVVVNRSETDGCGIYDDPADPRLDLVEARMLARLPGFSGVMALYISTKLHRRDGAPDYESEGRSYLAPWFVTNEVPSEDGRAGDDAAIELVIQPDLAGSERAVSRHALREAFWTELVLRNGYDGRLVLARSPVDFSNLFAPKPVFEMVDFPDVAHVTSGDDQTHPPQITWRSTVEKEGLYAVSLIHPETTVVPGDPGSGFYDRAWTILIPAEEGFASDIVFPDLRDAPSTGNSLDDFGGPFNAYRVVVESYAFHFDDPNDPSDDAKVQFTGEAYAISQLQRDMIGYSRSSLAATVRTR